MHHNRKERGIEVTLNVTWLLVARRAPKRGTLQRAAVAREEETACLISGVRGERLHLLAGNPRKSTATRITAGYTWPLARGQSYKRSFNWQAARLSSGAGSPEQGSR